MGFWDRRQVIAGCAGWCNAHVSLVRTGTNTSEYVYLQAGWWFTHQTRRALGRRYTNPTCGDLDSRWRAN
ncbi:MAG: hypothetical protein CMJ75_01375 [Planctomycetaceae bacterium]|nr:hypothetical protein [Planctomycetaceae bacterium]